MRTKRLMTAAAGVLVVAAIAGGVAYATIPGDGNVYTVCMLKNVGTIRLIDPSLPSSSLLGHCTSLETQMSWNQKGQPGAPGLAGPAGPAGPAGAAGKEGTNGKDGTNGTKGTDGVSVTSAPEPAGTNCANGGSKFTAANGATYACNGATGNASVLISTEVGPATAAQPYTAWVTLFEDPNLGRLEAECVNATAGSFGDRAHVRWLNTTTTTIDSGTNGPIQPGNFRPIAVRTGNAIGLANEAGVIVEWIDENMRYDPNTSDHALYCEVYVRVTPHA